MTHSTEPNDEPIVLCKCGFPHPGVSFNNTLAVYTCNNCGGSVDLYSPRILDTNKPITPKPKCKRSECLYFTPDDFDFTEPSPITPKPKIVQFQTIIDSEGTQFQTALVNDGRIIERQFSKSTGWWLDWIDITGEIPE